MPDIPDIPDSASDSSPDARKVAVLKRVETALNQEIQAALGPDGLVEAVGMDDDGAVQIRLAGICQSCPATAMGLVLGLEDLVRKQAPEVRYLEVVP